MSAYSNYMRNKLVDWLWRGQSFTPPSTIYFGLNTAMASPSSGGTEVSGGSYARVAVTPSLGNFCGTQGNGSTGVSSGTSALTTNNVAIQFPAPTGDWGTLVGWTIWDSPSGGNLLMFGSLDVPLDVLTGDAAPLFDGGQLVLRVDQ